MPALNYLAVVAAAIVVFVFAAVYYSMMAGQAAKLSPAWADQTRPSPTMITIELVRALVVAVVVAGLVSLLGIADIVGAVTLALVLWIAFPVVLLSGSVIHEKVPWRLATIHAGDWLAKLLIIAIVVTIWR